MIRHLTPRRPPARGRHVAPRGDGFGRLVAVTTLGTFVPGSGLVASGLRRTGWVILTLFAVAVAVLVGLALSGRLLDLVLRLATRPDALLAVAVAVPVVALLWCLVIVVGHVRMRRARLRPSQRLAGALLVAAMVALVVAPGAIASRYALAQRSLVLTVFDEPQDVERDEELATPDIEARDPWAGTPRINVLLLGSDAGDDREGTRPDTMIVASIDTRTGDSVLFSLPRNLEGPPFPEGGVFAEQFPNGFHPSGSGCPSSNCLLNAVWDWAEANAHLFPGLERPGLAATRDAISATLGLPVDYYALVDLQGFIDVVDAMGGVRIDVERRLPIGGIDAEGNSVRPSGYIEPGEQILDGFNALWYARSRAGSDDYDRMRRQRCTIAAVVDQAQPATLARAFPQLAVSAERHVQTDIGASELDAFVELGRRVQRGTLRSLPFTNDVINTGNPDYEAIRALVQQALLPPAPAPSPQPATPAPAPPPTADAPETAPPDPPAAVNVEEVCG